MRRETRDIKDRKKSRESKKRELTKGKEREIVSEGGRKTKRESCRG